MCPLGTDITCTSDDKFGELSLKGQIPLTHVWGQICQWFINSVRDIACGACCGDAGRKIDAGRSVAATGVEKGDEGHVVKEPVGASRSIVGKEIIAEGGSGDQLVP